MRVVFLDIDGVLNNDPWIAGQDRDRWYEGIQPDKGHLQMCRENVAFLGEILALTGAKVVVSSAWRLHHTKEQIGAALRVHGVDADIVGATPSITARPGFYGASPVQRGEEVIDWLADHPEVKGYVVLDDRTDFDGIEDHLVNTSSFTGLTCDDIDRAVEICLRPCDEEVTSEFQMRA